MALATATRHPLYGPWIRGQFALNHVDPRMPIDDWIAAVHATLVTAPYDVLKSLNDQLIVLAVQVDPQRARETWGVLPEHQVTTPAERKFSGNEQR